MDTTMDSPFPWRLPRPSGRAAGRNQRVGMGALRPSPVEEDSARFYWIASRNAPEGEEQITSVVKQPATPVQPQMPVLQCSIMPTAHPWGVAPGCEAQNWTCFLQSR